MNLLDFSQKYFANVQGHLYDRDMFFKFRDQFRIDKTVGQQWKVHVEEKDFEKELSLFILKNS